MANITINVPKNSSGIFEKPADEVPFEMEQDRYVAQRKFDEANQNRRMFQEQIMRDEAEERKTYSSILNLRQKYSDPKIINMQLNRRFKNASDFAEHIKREQNLDLSKVEDVAKLHFELDQYREIKAPEYQREWDKGYVYAKTMLGVNDETAKKLADDRVLRWEDEYIEPAYKNLFLEAKKNSVINVPDDVNLAGVGTDFLSNAISSLSKIEKAGGTLRIEYVDGKRKAVAYDASGEPIKEETLYKINPTFASNIYSAFSDVVQKNVFQSYINAGLPVDDDKIKTIAEAEFLKQMLSVSKETFNGNFDEARANIAVGSGAKYTSLTDFQNQFVNNVIKYLKDSRDKISASDRAASELYDIMKQGISSDIREMFGAIDKQDRYGNVIKGKVSQDAIKNYANLYKSEFEGDVDIEKVKELISETYLASGKMGDFDSDVRRRIVDDVLGDPSVVGFVNQVAGQIEAQIAKEKNAIQDFANQKEMEEIKLKGKKELIKYKADMSSNIGNAHIVANEGVLNEVSGIVKDLTKTKDGKYDKNLLKYYGINYEEINTNIEGDSVFGVKIKPMGYIDDAGNYIADDDSAPIERAMIDLYKNNNSFVKSVYEKADIDLDLSKYNDETYLKALSLAGEGIALQGEGKLKIKQYISNPEHIKKFLSSLPSDKPKNIELIAFAMKKEPNRYIGTKITKKEIESSIPLLFDKSGVKQYEKQNESGALFKRDVDSFLSSYGSRLNSFKKSDKINQLKNISNAFSGKNSDEIPLLKNQPDDIKYMWDVYGRENPMFGAFLFHVISEN